MLTRSHPQLCEPERTLRTPRHAARNHRPPNQQMLPEVAPAIKPQPMSKQPASSCTGTRPLRNAGATARDSRAERGPGPAPAAAPPRPHHRATSAPNWTPLGQRFMLPSSAAAAHTNRHEIQPRCRHRPSTTVSSRGGAPPGRNTARMGDAPSLDFKVRKSHENLGHVTRRAFFLL